MPAGYSKTPLAKKLGLKENFKVLLFQEPDNYWQLLGELPPNVVQLKTKRTESADFIHLFFVRAKAFEKHVSSYIPALKKNGLMWISWPKGASGITMDLKREPIREHLLSLGLVDVKVAAVDKNWSGLKFVYRLKDR